MEEYRRSGYLFEDFRLFHNADTRRKQIPVHYHEFHKILLLLSGNVSYMIEGREYTLCPGDVVLVSAGRIHRPVIHDHSLYERIIFYISPHFFQEENGAQLNLFGDGPELLRFSGETAARINRLALQLKEAAHDEGYACELLRRIRFLELLIWLKRAMSSDQTVFQTEISGNPLILSALDYIHAHLAQEDLSIDSIASAVSAGRSYLMHLFRSQVGYTIGQYITEKRLVMADALIESGMSVAHAAEKCGFKNYAAYYYANRQRKTRSALRSEVRRVSPEEE